jgi:putative sigma-54 modulation protein
MEVEFVARHYAADDQLRNAAAEKLRRVAKLLEEPIEARLTFEKEKHREIVDAQIAHRHGTLQATEESGSMRESLDLLVDNLAEQAKRARKRYQDRRRSQARRAQADAHWPLDVVEKGSVGNEAPRVVRSSLLRIKPMTLEDAGLELESARLGFVVFRDAATQRINVLFRRDDGNYGLIAPEF